MLLLLYCTDKICDQISDAVLDAHLKQDPDAKVACGMLTFFWGGLWGYSNILHGFFLIWCHPKIMKMNVDGVCLETVAKTGMILLAGEVTSRAVVDYQKVVRDTIKHIGYDDSTKG